MTKRTKFSSIQKITLISLLTLTLLASTGGLILSAEELTGREIIEKVDSAPTPETVNATLTMNLINKDGEEKIRKLEAWKRGNEDSVMVFREPENLAGTGLLKTVNDEGEEKTWLYLPSLDITKEMSQEAENKQFMGSDFSYDDLGSRNVDEYTYELIREESSDGETIYVVEGVAKNPEKAGYSRVRSWISEKNWKPKKVEYYDLDGELLKVQRNSSIEKIRDFWVVRKMIMENVQRGSKTVLTWKEYKINTELPANIFDPEALPELTKEG
ncbi:outer membrane lipoprotein-sorting protein [Candidatus Bipolaricaulota bacterium]|nr:outer membrane lipoprotein-sorting protein [Candidatus Bipolaricaulota bacterium]